MIEERNMLLQHYQLHETSIEQRVTTADIQAKVAARQPAAASYNMMKTTRNSTCECLLQMYVLQVSYCSLF